ncbi:MAG: hypothetical protein JO199_05395 [Candidatus Eremiobacteraeota bacterium]|nr:hypothetical protein [Candidatus Eremiobacteraeota bacterium]
MLPPPVPTISASPAPSATPRELKTIVTVKSSPYCTSLVQHFNGALLPILANDRTLERSSETLDGLNELWSHVDYISAYFKVRDRLGKESAELNGSLDQIQSEINALRAGGKLAEDPQAAQEIDAAAHQLQLVYDQQRTIEEELTELHDNMVRYNIMAAPPPREGNPMQYALTSQDLKNAKEYTRFNRRIGAIDYSEDQAVTMATDIAEKRCGAP